MATITAVKSFIVQAPGPRFTLVGLVSSSIFLVINVLSSVLSYFPFNRSFGRKRGNGDLSRDL
jgi:hypothetical protein